MGCLFGYCGQPAPGLLAQMAEILSHRCKCGWEKTRTDAGADHVVEIGHGLPPWSPAPRVAKLSERRIAFGYSGVIFNMETPPGRDEDTPRIPDGLVRDPEKGLQALEGAFVAALAQGDVTHLVRDPAGVKALYWTRHRDRLVFASEIKALFADPSVHRTLRPGALPEYLTFSFVPGENTMFRDIYELQPGTVLTCRNGQVTRNRHFRSEATEWIEGNPRSAEDCAAKVRADLETSVRECCNLTETPPAVFLSGGIDSSAVLALAAREFPGVPLKTFSIHFGSPYANENEFVSLMTARYETDHSWLEIRPKRFLKRMREIIWKLDDPIGDPITVPNFLISEAASRVARVVLNGEGGDPCFGGPKNIPMMLARLYGPLPGESENSWQERNYLRSYRKCFTDLERILNPDVYREAGGEEALTAIITPFLTARKPARFLNRLMNINIRLKGANLILVKVDKMSSANGLLALPPLFSKRIIETSMACPPHFKLRGNVEKWVLKRAVADILPHPIIERPKSGMMVPVRHWLRKEMRGYAKKVLSKKQLRQVGLFNPDYVHSLLRYDKAEARNNRFGLKLWMLITFMLWYDQMVEAPRVNGG
ncbi:asparagine synthase [Desulfonema ishimotonii]|uniref:asparagine synthase (glutamine-hydrolyzing) n=1 Tax=Desulfonema ishimotonii TaxID=45657 RepID=A0A401G1G0_9BACT|nr:asparagine synthase-related protein [Desulfonema ishimotonii]GBC63045.1 asparagine synthase [Desulfonema ishimotonii]